MTIKNRELAPGTKLAGTYKGTTYACEVVTNEEGEAVFRLEDGRVFSSPSSAGKAVMNGVACNGWRFWSREGAEVPRAPRAATTVKAEVSPTTPRRVRQLKKLPNQRGVPEGEVRWFCSGCMKGFLVAAGGEPAACPEGHPAEVDDDFGGAGNE